MLSFQPPVSTLSGHLDAVGIFCSLRVSLTSALYACIVASEHGEYCVAVKKSVSQRYKISFFIVFVKY